MLKLNDTICFLLFFVLVLFTTGCAFTTDYITLGYQPQVSVTKVDGANEARVMVDLFDVRGMRDRVSVKKNGYGMEMAPIVAENNVSLLVTKAIELELTNRGFILGDGAGRLLVELQKFYNDFKSGFWSGTAAAEVVMNTQVKNSTGDILFSKLVVGSGSLPGIQLASGENAKVSLEDALTDAMSKLFADRGLIDAILKAAISRPGNPKQDGVVGSVK